MKNPSLNATSGDAVMASSTSISGSTEESLCVWGGQRSWERSALTLDPAGVQVSYVTTVQVGEVRTRVRTWVRTRVRRR